MRQQMLLALERNDEDASPCQCLPERVCRSVAEQYAGLIVAAVMEARKLEKEGSGHDDEW